MSILTGKLAVLTVIPVVGTGVAYPMTTKLGGGENQIELKTIDNFKRNCWVSIQGDQGEDDSFNKRLLACLEKKNSEKVRFYFYDKDKLSNSLPKEVTEVKYNGISSYNHSFTISLVGNEGNETINTPASTWNSVFNGSVEGVCRLESVKTLSEELKRLSCNNSSPQRLEEFKIN